VLKIRLNRMGAKKRPFYRIVAIDSHKARGGKFVEVLGTYNSIEKPAQITLDEEKIFVSTRVRNFQRPWPVFLKSQV
jgi:small subunit ribosomal protein S16